MANREKVLKDAAVSELVPEEYEAGYDARLRGESFSRGATQSWQAGWADANRALGGFDEEFSPNRAPFAIFRSGYEARWRGAPFDLSRSDEWKRSWITADVDLGLRASLTAE